MSQRHLDALQIVRWETTAAFNSSQKVNLMIVAEALNSETDQLLTAMIKSMGFQRKDIYIDTCTPLIAEHVIEKKPAILLALGDAAAHHLLKNQSSVALLRNQVHYYGNANIPLVITYHPAHLLSHPQDKKAAYADLLLTKHTLHTI